MYFFIIINILVFTIISNQKFKLLKNSTGFGDLDCNISHLAFASGVDFIIIIIFSPHQCYLALFVNNKFLFLLSVRFLPLKALEVVSIFLVYELVQSKFLPFL